MSLCSPEDEGCPEGVARQQHEGAHFEHQAHQRVFQIVHVQVADADPGVVDERQHGHHGGHLHELPLEELRPGDVVELGQRTDATEKEDGVERHDEARDALGEPVAQAVMGAGHDSLNGHVEP